MKFSITIPSFKSRYLKEAIDSVVAQTYEDWELIVVDDYSPEDLKAVVLPYLNDSRVHYYRNDKNCGAVDVVDNWNICLSYCTGDYVICIGDDDRLKPYCLEEYVKLITKYPDLNVYHARTDIIDENGNITGCQEERPEWESAISFLWNRWDNRKNQYIGDFCYEIKSLRKYGGYYKLPLAWSSDDVTAVRASDGKGIANILKPCFEYRQNRYTITSSKNGRIKAQATISAFEWLEEFVDRQKNIQQNENDKELLKTISSVGNRYRRLDLGKDCIDDLGGNPFKLPYWIKLLNPYHYSCILFMRWYLRSVFNIVFGKFKTK